MYKKCNIDVSSWIRFKSSKMEEWEHMRVTKCKICGKEIGIQGAIILIENKRRYYFWNDEERDIFIYQNKKMIWKISVIVLYTI